MKNSIHLLITVSLLAPGAAAQTRTFAIPPPAGGGADDSTAVLPFLQSASSPDPGFTATRVIFDAGTYNLDYKNDFANWIEFEDVDDLEIVGHPSGTTINWGGYDPNFQTTNNQSWLAGLRFRNCENVTIRDLDVQVERAMASEGRLLSADPVTGDIIFEISDPALMLPTGTGFGNGSLFVVEALYVVHELGSKRERQEMPLARFFGPLVRTQTVSTTPAGTQQVTIQVENTKAWQQSRLGYINSLATSGEYRFVVIHQATAWSTSAFRFFRCSNVSMESCNISSMVQSVLLEVSDTARFVDVNTSPKDPDWMVGATRSGFGGVYACRGSLTFRDCRIVGGWDDGIEVTGFRWAQAQTDPTPFVSITSTYPSNPGYAFDQNAFAAHDLEPGAPLSFYTPDLTTVIHATTISSILTNPDGTVEVKLTQDPPLGVSVVGAPVAFRGNVYSSASIENCFIFGGKGNGILVAGPNVTVKDNVILNNGDAAIRAHCVIEGDFSNGDSFGLSNCGPAATNLNIVGNIISGSNALDAGSWAWPQAANWGEAVGAIDVSVTYISNPGVDEVFTRAPATASSQVTISGNEIYDTDGAGICMSSVTGASITGNRFGKNIARQFIGQGVDENHLVLVVNCDQVLVQDNVALNFTFPYPRSFTASASTNVTVVNNNWP